MPEVEKNSEVFYDAIWRDWSDMLRYSPAPKFRRKKMLRWLRSIPCASVLDVGCGNGEFLHEAYSMLPHLKYSGTDVSETTVERNRTRFPMMEFAVCDLDKGAHAGQYDLVVCMEVIEHTADYRASVQRLVSMTGKALLISVPCGPVFEIDRRVGHTMHFSGNEIESELMNNGMRIVKSERWGFPFFNLYKYIINMFPDQISDSFLSSKNYSRMQKIISSVIYGSFHLNFPWLGYQLFVLAVR
jgi:SAM-dependent methyltransferase